MYLALNSSSYKTPFTLNLQNRYLQFVANALECSLTKFWRVLLLKTASSKMYCGSVSPDNIIAAKLQTSLSTLKCNQHMVGLKQNNILERKELTSKDWTEVLFRAV